MIRYYDMLQFLCFQDDMSHWLNIFVSSSFLLDFIFMMVHIMQSFLTSEGHPTRINAFKFFESTELYIHFLCWYQVNNENALVIS